MEHHMLKESVIYIEFFLKGSFIFSCQKSWFSDKSDIWDKIFDLANQYNVPISFIQAKEVVVEIPISFPKNYMKNLIGDLKISYENKE